MSLRKGIFWSAVDRFSAQGLQFLMTIIITRFVTPEEYGLVAMLAIFIALSNSIIESGFSSALIQKQNRTDLDFSAVFYYNVLIAIGLYLLLYFSSPLIAGFYQEPRLELLTKVICLSLIISSFNVVPNAKLTIAMDFKSITKASLLSGLLSGCVGVYMAISGYGVWAIVFQSLLQYLINSIILWYFIKWHPLLRFSIASFKSLYSFGSKMMFSGLLHTIYLNLYTLVIGKFINAHTVGLFNRSNSLAQYPSTNIVGIVNRVYYPALCNLQNDTKSFADLFHSYLRMACFVIFPLSALLAALADPLIRILLTDKWAGTIIPLQIISIAYMFYPVMLINNQPLQALNHTTMFLISEIIKKIVAVILLLLSLNYGLHFLCLSILIYNMLDILIILMFTRRIMATGYRKQLKELMPIFLCSIISGSVVFLFVSYVDIHIFFLLIVGTIIGIISYAILSHLFRIQEIRIINNIIKKYVQSNNSNTSL